MLGDHSKIPGELKPSPEPKLVFPFDAPGFALNHFTVSMFNTLFFHKQGKAHVKALHDYEPFFYPLDAVLRWNRMYGKRGLVQFQYAHPVGACERRHHRHPAARSPNPAWPASSPCSRPSATCPRSA